jgi:hypothetical protein
MILNKQVEEYKKKHVVELYLQHPDEITRDFINENEMRDDYEGREVLELLQNAVDQVEVGGKIHIGLVNDILTVANTGEPFNFDGVKSLMKSNLSPKRLNKNMIGQKGLGFRSLLNWSNDISIYSNNLSIRFSESYRKSFFEDVRIFESTALLVAPEVIENIDKKDFETIINIKILNESRISEVKRQLNAIDKYTLLFLNKVNELSVRNNDQITKFRRETDNDIVIISENDEQFIFNTYSKKGIIDDKNYEIVIAYDETINQRDNKLYSFFETNINFPIKWKCHATFELETNRGGIKKNEINLRLLSELADFVCCKASGLMGTANNPYEAFDSLLKINDFPAGLNIKGIDFNDTYQKYFEDAKVLPTYSGSKTSLKSKPIFYDTTPFFFSQIENSNILIESIDKKRNEIIEEYCMQFDDNTLMKIIDENSKEWSIQQNITIFLWWEKEFPNSNLLPKLIKSFEGDYIEADTIVYFVRGRDLNIPTWSRIYKLDPLFEQELKMQIQRIEGFTEELNKQSTPIIERVIAQNSGRKTYDKKIIPHIIFRDADASTILTPVNASIDNDYENAVSFVKWLWTNYSNKEDWTAPIDLTFNLPSKNNTVAKSFNLYFDETYDNPLGNKLFSNNKYLPFIGFDQIGLDIEQKHDFKTFVSKLGVLDYLPFVERNIQDTKFRQLYSRDYLLSKLPKYEIDARNPRLSNLTFNVIEDLEEILTNLTIDEIFEWIISDSKLYDELKLKHSGRISFNYAAQIQAYRSFSFNDYSKSYIKHIFRNSKWLEIENVKYGPNQCVFAYSGLDISKIVPTISNGMVKELSDLMGVTQKEVREFLTEVGVNSNITGLESDDFYHVLLELPKLDESGQISEKIYREVIDFEGKISTSSTNYTKFIKEGYVFTQNHDGKKYHLATDSYFSNSIQVNVGNYHIIRTPLRNGSFELFNKVFGVKKFEEKYQVKENSIIIHQYDNDFQLNFKEFISYARAWSERNDNIKKRIENIRVNIVSKIALFDNNEELSINSNYMLIVDKNSWYIYVSNEEKLDYRQISNCIEELFAQVANTTNSEIPNQLGELFRDREGRKYLVEKHFGTIDAINQIYQNQIRVSLANSLSISYDSNELNEIDFDHFRSINNCEPLIKLLLNHNKDIENLKENGFEYIEYIDFRPFYQSKISNYIAEHEEMFKSALYIHFKSQELQKKKKFYREYLIFKNFRLKNENIDNSVHYKYEEVLINTFPTLNCNPIKVDVDKIYNENFEQISSTFDINNFGDFIDENIELKSLIYFLDNEISELIKQDFKNTFETDFIDADNENKVDKKIEDITLSRSKINPDLSHTHVEHSTPSSKTNTKSSIDRENKIKEKNGKYAEKLVRDKLIETIPSLKWTSENSDIPSERNISAIYDMEYVKEGQKHFIEVKAATKSFFMSLSEYNFAKNNSINYELYLVDLVKDEIDGPHSLSEFESSKVSTEFQFFFEKEE